MKNRLINIKTIHFIGWSLYLSFLFLFFSNIFSLEMAFFRAVQLSVLHAIIFYFNTLVLMPRLMEKRKYIRYFFAVMALMILFAGILYIIDFHIKPFGNSMIKGRGISRILNTEIENALAENPPHGSIIIWRSTMRSLSSIFAVVLISIVSKMFFQKISEDKNEAALQNENLVSEMKFLKSQVNPHFLFNALNNIYTLVLLKKDAAPAMLMKLSEMLRYMLYECNDDLVPLNKEISYINNYIELQQLKTEHPQNITTDFSEASGEIRIPPLLLIPFIENSFKHSRIVDADVGWITMQLSSNNKNIQFTISNSIPLVPIAKDKTKGIGLENVKRRLELLYPDNYDLKITETETEFTVNLNIFNKLSHN